MGGVMDRIAPTRRDLRPETLRRSNLNEERIRYALRQSNLTEDQIEERLEKRRSRLRGAPEETLQTGIAAQQQKNAIDAEYGDKTSLAGQMLKIGKTALTGGPSIGPVSLNPIKAGLDGLGYMQRQIGEPTAGHIVGSLSLAASQILRLDEDRKLSKVGSSYRSDVWGDGDWDFWSDAGDFQREREGLFKGEKFFSTILLDPTNLIGFGMLGKIPIIGRTALSMRIPAGTMPKIPLLPAKLSSVPGALERLPLVGGKIARRAYPIPQFGRPTLPGGAVGGKRFELSLGAIESGYVSAINLPFKAAGKVATRFPGSAIRLVTLGRDSGFSKINSKSRNQLIADAGARTSDIIRNARSLANNGGSHLAVTQAQWMKIVSDVLRRENDVLIPYAQLESDVHRKLRDVLLDTPPLEASGIDAYAAAAKAKSVSERLTSGELSLTLSRDIKFSVMEYRDKVIRGEMTTDEAAERIIRTLDGNVGDEFALNGVKSKLEHDTVGKIDDLEISLSSMDVARAEISITRLAMASERARVNSRFTQWQLDRGRMGAFIGGLDNLQTKLWQNTINRFLARPLATSVLKTPEYLISNIMEDSVRAITGRSSVVYRGVDDMSIDFAGYNVYSRGLFETQSTNVSRIADSSRYDQFQTRKNDFGMTDAAEKIGLAVPEGLQSFGRKFGDDWFDKANLIASNTRRGYFTERAYKRLSEFFQNTGTLTGLARALDSLPNALKVRNRLGKTPGSLQYGRIESTATIRAGNFDGDSVRKLIDELDKDTIDAKAVMGHIDNWASQDGTAFNPRIRAVWHDWAEAGADMNVLDDMLKRTDSELFDEFMAGPQRAMIQLEGLIQASKTAVTGTPEEKYMMMQTLNNSFMSLLEMPHRLIRTTAARNRRGEYGTAAKFDSNTRQELYNRTTKQIETVYDTIESRVEEVKALADQLTGDKTLSSLFADELSEGRRFRTARDQDLLKFFDSNGSEFVKAGERDTYFWDKVTDSLEASGNLHDLNRAGFKDSYQGALDKFAEKAGLRSATKKKFTPERLGEDVFKYSGNEAAIGRVMKGDIAQIQHAILSDAALGREQFINQVLRMASRRKMEIHPESAKRIGRGYDQVLAQLGLTERMQSQFASREELLKTLKSDIMSSKQASPFTGQVKQDLTDYINRVADEVDKLSPSAKANLKLESDKAVAEAAEDLKASFVNYDDQTMLDSFMQSIFPFWTFESRRIPYLARRGMQYPLMGKTMMPGGYYDSTTEEGYMPAFMGTDVDLNLLGGTVFNAPKRMFRATFPTQHDGPLQEYSEFEEAIGRFGFYPGPHVKILTDAVLPKIMGEDTETSEMLPTQYSNLINAFTAVTETDVPIGKYGSGSVTDIPGLGAALKPISNQIVTIKSYLFGDRFRERQVLKELWAMGLPPGDIDLKTMKPKPGSMITQDDIREAMRETSKKEFWTGMVGKIRYRDEDERVLRESIIQIYESQGLSRDEQFAAKKAGIPLNTLVQVSPEIKRMLNALPGQDAYRSVNAALRAPQAKYYADLTYDYHQQVLSDIEVINERQSNLDQDWLNGKVAPSVYRDQTKELKAERRNVGPDLRGRVMTRDNDPNSPTFMKMVTAIKPQLWVVDPVTGEETLTRGGEGARFFDVPMSPEEYQAALREVGKDDFLTIRHPVEEMVEDYYDIIPEDLDGDGRPEWSRFYKAREAYIENVDREYGIEFDEAIKKQHFDGDILTAQGILSQLTTRTYNRNTNKWNKTPILAAYWELDDQIAEQFGIGGEEGLLNHRRRADMIGDELSKESFKRNPTLRRYDRELRRARERMRIQDPILDYALGVYGFTGQDVTFKGRVARQWWAEDNLSPRLSRLERVL